MSEEILSAVPTSQGRQRGAAPATETDFYPRPGTVFHGYRLVERIAKTGEADLWRALPHSQDETEASPETEVALKFYRFRQFKDAVNEIPSGAHLLPRSSVYNAMGVLCEAFPYRPLGHLGKHAQRFKGNETLCIELIRQLTDAIESLHSEDIQHRDIKPENILMGSLDPLNIELADFGSADYSSMTVDVTNAQGTLRYIAPEAAMGTYSKASDWYSVGLIIAELYTGVKIRSDEVTLYKVAQGKDRIPTTITASPTLEGIIKGLLDPDFRSRWQGRHIKNWLDKPSGRAPIRNANRRNALGAIMILLGVLAALIVAGALAYHMLQSLGVYFGAKSAETGQETPHTVLSGLQVASEVIRDTAFVVAIVGVMTAFVGRAREGIVLLFMAGVVFMIITFVSAMI